MQFIDCLCILVLKLRAVTCKCIPHVWVGLQYHDVNAHVTVHMNWISAQNVRQTYDITAYDLCVIIPIA